MAKTRFVLIGPGAVGKVLARRLAASGWQCAGVCGRGSAAGRRLAKELGAPYWNSVEKIELKSGFILLPVGTHMIAPIANELSKLPLNWPKISVLHHSGVLDTKPLAPLQKVGATVGACHPFMTFPRFGGKVKAGSKEDRNDPKYPPFFGIDGDERGLAACQKVVKACKSNSFVVKGGDRVAYHAAAVMACTLLGANIAMSVDILRKVGISEKSARDAVMSIAQETLANFSEFGIEKSWTGPPVRGDRKTVAAHTKAIRKVSPETAKVYKSLSEWVMRHAAKRT
ncbi:MAG: DUF2520 domain-containing protein [Calditrichaeota bacterium]|nr:DUF2520 domain-containing protein [Calditrichota bacterium]MCB9369731.1 DUF2520 domain-containing protein [Calditrichota bacterium]